MPKKLKMNVEEDARKATTSVKKLGNSLKKTGRQGADAGKRLTKAWSSSTEQLARMTLVSAKVTAAFYGASKAWDFAKFGANLNQSRQAFENMASSYGTNADQILADLNRVSAGAVDTATMIQKAGTAMMMGIDPTKLDDLMRIARSTSRLTGQTITKSFEDISLAVGRQSKMILDNLGIIVSAEDANKRYAKQLGKTSDDLTDVERKQAFLNETLLKGNDLVTRLGDETLTGAERIQQMEAAFKNLYQTIASQVAPALSEFITILTDWLKDPMRPITIAEQIEEQHKRIQKIQKEIENTVRATSPGTLKGPPSASTGKPGVPMAIGPKSANASFPIIIPGQDAMDATNDMAEQDKIRRSLAETGSTAVERLNILQKQLAVERATLASMETERDLQERIEISKRQMEGMLKSKRGKRYVAEQDAIRMALEPGAVPKVDPKDAMAKLLPIKVKLNDLTRESTAALILNQAEMKKAADEELARLEELKQLKEDMKQADIEHATAYDEALIAGNEAMDKMLEDRKQKIIELGDQFLASPMSKMFTDWAMGAKSFKESFSDMAQSIAEDIMMMVIRAQLLHWFKAATGTGGGFGIVSGLFGRTGGAFDNGKQMPGFADGGVASGPSSGYPVTLHGQEAVLPLKRGPSGNLGVEVSGSQPTNNINTTINVTVGQQGAAGGYNKAQGNLIAAAIKAEFNKNLIEQQRPGGLLYGRTS